MVVVTKRDVLEDLKGEVLCPARDKVPIIKGYLEKGPGYLSTDELMAFRAIAWAVSLDFIVIDVDPRHFEGKGVLKAFKDKYGVNPRTIVKSPNGGLHLYFKNPSKKKVRAHHPGGEFKGFEYKTNYRMIHIPFSVSSKKENGVYKTYDIVRWVPLNDLSDIPELLLEEIEYKQAFFSPQPVIGGLESKDTLISSCSSYLERSDIAVEGSNGDLTTFKVCNIGLKFGLSLEEFFPLLLEWNSKCLPPWREEDLIKKLKYVYNRGVNGR